MTTEQRFIFTDGSVNTKLGFGYGAYLIVTEIELFTESTEPVVKVKRFEETSSVKLELQTLLWALNELKEFTEKIILYTDSQNIIGLHGRRERLEKNNYYSKKNKRIGNWELYQEFYVLTDNMNIEIVKIEGHKRTSLKNSIDRLFTLVDRASRNAMRGEK